MDVVTAGIDGAANATIDDVQIRFAAAIDAAMQDCAIIDVTMAALQ
jgi:hypothetical protein